MHSKSPAGRRADKSPKLDAAPRQERSRATRERILSALAALLESKTFDQISVAELTGAAQCSMSSFYARFPTKDTLLDAFFDRFFEFSNERVGAALAGIASEVVVESRARGLVEFLLRSYREHRGLLRSLILHDRTNPEAGFGARTRAHKQQATTVFLGLLLKRKVCEADRRAATSVSFGLWLVTQAIEQIVLFDDPLMGGDRLPERRLVDELTFVLLRTLESMPQEAASI